MDFVDLAIEYTDLNTFNLDTQETIVRIADLFQRRTNCKVESLSLSDISQFKAATLKVAKSVTYNGYLRYLRILGDYAVDQGYLERNFFRTARTAPNSRPAPKLIADNDLWVLNDHLMRNPERYDPVWFWATVIKTLYYTGVRRKQLVNLQLRDLDLELRTVFLRVQGSKTHREWTIPLHRHLIDDFRNLVTRNERALGRRMTLNEPLFNVTWHNPRYVCCPHNPDLMQTRAITDFFKRVNKRTGLSISAHKFRHNIATRLCNPASGEPDIFATQSLLGHTSIQTTRGYVLTSTERLHRVIDGFEMPSLARKPFMRTDNDVICNTDGVVVSPRRT